MATVGIMHSGSDILAKKFIDVIKNRMNTDCNTQPQYYGPHYPKPKVTLEDIADDLISKNVELIIAAGGSRSADAAIKRRGHAAMTKIVFTSVTPYILNSLNNNTTAGVCARTSDQDVARLDWLLTLPLAGNRIGVLRNSNRGDHSKQKQDLDDAITGRAGIPVHRDINTSHSM